MELRDRIKTARKALGISQEALARRADVSLSLINQIERGVVVDPHYSTLVSIAEALSMSIGELLGEPVPLGEAPSPEAGAGDKPKPEVSRSLDVRWNARELVGANLDIRWKIEELIRLAVRRVARGENEDIVVRETTKAIEDLQAA